MKQMKDKALRSKEGENIHGTQGVVKYEDYMQRKEIKIFINPERL